MGIQQDEVVAEEEGVEVEEVEAEVMIAGIEEVIAELKEAGVLEDVPIVDQIETLHQAVKGKGVTSVIIATNLVTLQGIALTNP